METVAIVKFSALGDVIWTLPLVKLILEKREDVLLTWFLDPFYLSLIPQHPRLKIYPYKKPRSLKNYLQLIFSIRKLSFDKVLCLQSGLRINILYPFF